MRGASTFTAANGRSVPRARFKCENRFYKNSVERWRKYEAFLAPLLAEIAPIGA